MTAEVVHAYAALDPDCVLDAIESVGLAPDGRLLALNSFENRVYQIGLEDGSFVVGKFYRPARWSDAAIAEEHALSEELRAAELPVIAPLQLDGKSLHVFNRYRFAVYPRAGGRAPELESADHLAWMGRLLARMHNVGAQKSFVHRGRIDRNTLVTRPAAEVMQSDLLPPQLQDRYAAAIGQIEQALAGHDADWESAACIRLHGDCHAGNVLWTDAGPHFVDLDDARTGPAVQDLWMLAGDEAALDALLEGYRQFRDFDDRQRALIPALRIMRQIHHAGWIAARWSDPAFPLAFPFVAEPRWWDEHVNDLREAAGNLAMS